MRVCVCVCVREHACRVSKLQKTGTANNGPSLVLLSFTLGSRLVRVFRFSRFSRTFRLLLFSLVSFFLYVYNTAPWKNVFRRCIYILRWKEYFRVILLVAKSFEGGDVLSFKMKRKNAFERNEFGICETLKVCLIELFDDFFLFFFI